MRTTHRIALVAGLLALAAASWASAAQATEDILDKRISLNLKDARAAELFPLFAVLIEAELDLDFETDETVQLVFDGITARTGLNAFCESVGCGWRLIDEEPRVLRFYSLEKMLADKRALAYDKSISIDLKEAAAGQVLKLAGHVLDVELVVDDSLKEHTITLVRDQTTVSQFLDDVCREIDCDWELVGGDPPRLLVAPLGQSPDS